MTTAGPAHPGSSRRLGNAVLTGGAVVSGLLAYAFFATVTRRIGAGPAAPFAMLWAFWAYASAALTFPVQHWAARSVAVDGGERSVRESRWPLAAATAGVAAVAGAAAFAFRGTLFPGGGGVFWALVVATCLGAAATGLVRGVLSARGRLGAVAATLVAENGIRFALALGLAFAGVGEAWAYGLCLVAGYVGCLAWPSAWRLDDAGAPRRGSPLAFLGSASSGQLLGHAVLTSGPVALAVLGGAPVAVTALFAGLALFRAPYTLLVGAVAGLSTTLAGHAAAGRRALLRTFGRRMLLLLGLGLPGAAGVGALVGPPLLPLVFGGDVRLGAGTCALLAVACTVAMGNLVAGVLLVSLGRPAALTRGWAAALLPGAGVLWVGSLAGASGAATVLVAWALLAVEAAALALLVAAGVRAVATVGEPVSDPSGRATE